MAMKIVNSVKKALDVLDILIFDDINREGIPLSELSRRSGIPANTLHGLVSSLVVCGYACQKPNTSYLAGRKIDDVGKQNMIRRDLAVEIQSLLASCREKTGEGIVFYTLINAERVPIHQVNRVGVFNFDFEQLRKADFFAAATSRVMFAFSDAEGRSRIIARWGMPGAVWDNIDTAKELEAAAERIRSDGYAGVISHQGQIYSVATPVLDKTGALFGAVGLYAPVSACDERRKRFFMQQMSDLASRISTLT